MSYIQYIRTHCASSVYQLYRSTPTPTFIGAEGEEGDDGVPLPAGARHLHLVVQDGQAEQDVGLGGTEVDRGHVVCLHSDGVARFNK